VNWPPLNSLMVTVKLTVTVNGTALEELTTVLFPEPSL
jgi:hypothetical protein